MKLQILAFVVGLFAVVSSFAEGRGIREVGHGACHADMEKFCKDVKPGDGRMMECMKSHEPDLSAGCKEMMASKKAEMKEHAREAREACKGDIDKFCKTVQPGAGRVIECLKSHESELSVACKEMQAKVRRGRMHKKD